MNKTTKKLMILGAGEAQLSLIQESIALGYYTIVCDMRPEMEGSKIADKYYQVNYMKKEEILEIAKEEEIDGVISNSEPAMINVSYLVDTLHLPGNSTESLLTLMQKEKFRKLQEEVGVFAPKSYSVKTFEEAKSVLEKIAYPIIMKPTESSGSRGTTKMNAYHLETAAKVFDTCMEYSRNGLVTIEEFVEMDGLETCDFEAFVFGDDILIDGLYGNSRDAKFPLIPSNKTLPPVHSIEKRKMVIDDVSKLLKASGVTLGEFNVEAYFDTKGHLFIIEANVRQGGNEIPALIKEQTGVDLTKLLVTLSVNDLTYYNELKTFKRLNQFIILDLVFSEKDGIYNGLYIDECLKDHVQWVEEFYKVNDKVSKAHDAEDVIAYVDLKFDTRDQQLYYKDRLNEFIYAKIKE